MDVPKKKFSLMNLEWRWSLANMLWGIPTAVASFVLPAWAVNVSNVFAEYAPLSWVLAGFMGLFAASIVFVIMAWGRSKWVRARYDARMLAIGGAVDPLGKTFERKRIYINEFCLPSHPHVEGKTFIDCEIIGPANLILIEGNSISDARYPISDCVWLKEGAFPNNGYVFRHCSFRGCNFSRITFMLPSHETQMFSEFHYIKWLTESPSGQGELPINAQTESIENQSPQEIAEEPN